MALRTSPRPRRIAVMDLGSNSVKLLVAQMQKGLRPHVLLEKSEGTRLGEGIHRHFRLEGGAMDRTLEALEGYRRDSEALGVREWRAVATSAVRDADNGRDFERKFRKQMGFGLDILSGEEEAKLIFRGATSDRDLVEPKTPLLVMDSGGGSAEWIRGTPEKIDRQASLELGCVRMTERFLQGDPYTRGSYRNLLGYYEERLRPIRGDFSAKGRTMIGTGGSICTAAALDMDLPSFSNSHVHGYTMALETITAMVEKLRALKNSHRLDLRGLPRKRADIIVAGLALFMVAMRMLGARKVTVSTRGLRYGILIESAGETRKA